MTQLFHDDALAPISRGPAPHISVNRHPPVGTLNGLRRRFFAAGQKTSADELKSHAANTLRTPLAKSPFPKEPFTRFASFFSAPQPPPTKPLPTSPAQSAYRFRPSAALDLSRATQPTRHFGKAAQTTEINRSYLRLSVFICG